MLCLMTGAAQTDELPHLRPVRLDIPHRQRKIRPIAQVLYMMHHRRTAVSPARLAPLAFIMIEREPLPPLLLPSVGRVKHKRIPVIQTFPDLILIHFLYEKAAPKDGSCEIVHAGNMVMVAEAGIEPTISRL